MVEINHKKAPLFCKSLLQLARKFLFNLGSNTRHFLTNILQMQIFPCRIRKYLFGPELGRCWRKKGWEESTWTFKLATQVWKWKFENPDFGPEYNADGNDHGNALQCWYMRCRCNKQKMKIEFIWVQCILYVWITLYIYKPKNIKKFQLVKFRYFKEFEFAQFEILQIETLHLQLGERLAGNYWSLSLHNLLEAASFSF